MLLDRITLELLSEELRAAWSGRRLRQAAADAEGMSLEAQGASEHSLQVRFGPPGGLALGPSPERPERGDRSLRYLLGARVEAVSCAEGDRVLQVRLQRGDAAGDPTYGVLHVVLVPPRYRLALVGERHGRVLGTWSAGGDRRAPRTGDSYRSPGLSGRLDPAAIERADWEAVLAGEGTLEEAMRRSLAGLDRHVIARWCAEAGADPTRPLSDCGPAVAERLHEAGRRLHGGCRLQVFRWPAGGGWVRVSLLEPVAAAEVQVFGSVSDALRAPLAEAAPSAGAGQRSRLSRAAGRLERRRAALNADLEEARQVDHLERAAHSLMAAGDPGARGPGRLEVTDVHDPEAAAIVVELEPGRSAAGQAGRMLKRARRLRRRLEVLPPRLERVEEQLEETRLLLKKLEKNRDNQLPEKEMERWEENLGLNRDGRAAADGRQDSPAHPRRYRTSSGWSVWAGRNNQENDRLSHRMAAQNDFWFHARGYSGSHVILRREGRKDEPSRKTLEEAAAVAAWWSKGRTAGKVPVIYTLAKYVSRPRGGPPGLASVRREKTLMVRPGLLPAEEGG